DVSAATEKRGGEKGPALVAATGKCADAGTGSGPAGAGASLRRQACGGQATAACAAAGRQDAILATRRQVSALRYLYRISVSGCVQLSDRQARDALDRLADFRRQDAACFLVEHFQLRVNLQHVVVGHADQLVVLQLADEILQYIAIEKFRRVELVQQRQALRGLVGQFFQLCQGQRAAAA